jgi:hypothetical protein
MSKPKGHRRGGLSQDPTKRATQLANLNGGRGDRGLQRSRKHGAYAAIAERELEAKVAELYHAIGEDLPVREEDGGVPAADVIVLRQLAETLVRRERVRETEVRHGIEAPDGKLRGVVEYGLRLDAHVLRLSEQLGLTPTSRARLGLDLARAKGSSLAAEMEAARLARLRREAAVDADAAGDE